MYRRFLLLVCMVACVLAMGAVQQPRRPLRVVGTPPSGGGGGGTPATLTFADMSCDGVFMGPNSATSDGLVPNTTWASRTLVAVKVTGSTRSYYQTGGDGKILEYAEPTLLPCDSTLATLKTNQLVTGITDWGYFPYRWPLDYAPGGNPALAGALSYDATSGRLYVNFSGTYVNLPGGINTISAVTFSGTMNLVGCWALDDRSQTTGQPMGALGMLQTPSWFRTANGMGSETMLVHGGWFAGSTSLNSYGPSLEGVDPANLTANGCTTNTLLPQGSVLSRYPQNTEGPNCASNFSWLTGIDLGCTPAVAPTAPYPAKTSFTAYSQNLWNTSWEPYGGYGYWGDNTQGTCNWYDDSSKSGLICSLGTMSGWMNTTVSSISSYSWPYFTVVIPSLDMHDGANVQAGDRGWMQICNYAVDGELCVRENMNDFAFIEVDGVNTATNEVAAHVLLSGASTGTIGPFVGGQFQMGVRYFAGSPGASRTDFRMQIYSPTSLASVLSGAATYTPMYTEDVVVTRGTYGWVTQFGYPGSPTGGILARLGGPYMSSVQVDPANHKIILCSQGARSLEGLGIDAAICHVMSVSH